MRIRISPIVLLLAATLMMSSCLKDDDSNAATEYSNDAVITAFSLGTLNQVRDTTTRDGRDSSYVAHIVGSRYRFYIDQKQGRIYNVDSLPYGVDSRHVLTTISTANNGIVVLKSAKSDSIKYYVASDSIDYSVPRTFYVYSAQGTGFRTYTVTVNVKRERPGTVGWSQAATVADFAQLKATRAVSLDGRIFVFGSDGTATKAYRAMETNAGGWTALPTSFGSDAYANVVTYNHELYLLDDGKLMHSSDGTSWQPTDTGATLTRLVAASTTRLYAYDASGVMIYSEDDGATWHADVLDNAQNMLPTQSLASITWPSRTNDDIDQTLLVGQTAASSSSIAWLKTFDYSTARHDNPWTLIENDNYRLPLMQNLSLVSLDNRVFAFGSNGTNAYRPIYVSNDGGIVWKTTAALALPQAFAADYGPIAVTADSRGRIWLIGGSKGQVWIGNFSI